MPFKSCALAGKICETATIQYWYVPVQNEWGVIKPAETKASFANGDTVRVGHDTLPVYICALIREIVLDTACLQLLPRQEVLSQLRLRQVRQLACTAYCLDAACTCTRYHFSTNAIQAKKFRNRMCGLNDCRSAPTVGRSIHEQQISHGKASREHFHQNLGRPALSYYKPERTRKEKAKRGSAVQPTFVVRYPVDFRAI